MDQSDTDIQSICGVEVTRVLYSCTKMFALPLMGLDYVGLLSPSEVFALPKTQNALSSVLLDITVGQK